MRVRDVLISKGSSKVHTIHPDATVSELLQTMAELNVGALIVSTDGSTLLGLVSERDVVRKLRGVGDPGAVQVATIMTAQVHTCTPDESVDELMSTMTERRVRHLPVVDGDGNLVGLLSIGDAVKFRIGQLEFERDQLSNYVSS